MTPTRSEIEALRDRLRAVIELPRTSPEVDAAFLAAADLLDALLKQEPVAWLLYTRTELGNELWCAHEKEADARSYAALYRDDSKPRVVAVYAAPVVEEKK